MNLNSHICKFINENKVDWEEKLKKDYEVKVRRDQKLAIFNYAIVADFYNPIVQEARGIIIDVEKLEVVCWPFRKFGNYTEGYADKIDWNSAKVLEKVDGSIIKLWYDKQNQKWQFSTNKTIRAELAGVDGYPGLTYDSVIKKTLNYNQIPFDNLNKNCTYIFELVSPETKVVIEYKERMLYHLGTRSNLTGEEFECDIGIIKPKKYSLSSLDDCITAASELNKDNKEQISNEGFVVVDKNYNRVKIKSLDYVAMHHLSTMQELSKKTCIEMLILNPEKLEAIIAERAEFMPAIKYYEYKFSELVYRADQIAKFAKNLYEEYSHDRKAVASIIKKHPLAFIAFKHLDTNLSPEEILVQRGADYISLLIEDYQPIDILKEIKN